MSHVRGEDRGQTALLPSALEDYVTADGPIRVIDAFVDGLDVSGFGRAAPSGTGRPPYDPGPYELDSMRLKAAPGWGTVFYGASCPAAKTQRRAAEGSHENRIFRCRPHEVGLHPPHARRNIWPARLTHKANFPKVLSSAPL
jgi:hypothetical protein